MKAHDEYRKNILLVECNRLYHKITSKKLGGVNSAPRWTEGRHIRGRTNGHSISVSAHWQSVNLKILLTFDLG